MTRFLETSLKMPLRDVLPLIQERIMNQSTYFGIRTFKSPMDYWVYQEMLFEMKPDVIVEIGNANGGSTLALAHYCDLLGHGRIIALDIDQKAIPDMVRQHPRITFIEADACAALDKVKALIAPSEHVLVIEDSSHTYENTLAVLRAYSGFVRPGEYIIVEDSICQHGLKLGPRPGPFEAVESFVAESDEFEIDRSKESFLITWNPKGYVRRKRASDPRTPIPARAQKKSLLQRLWQR